MMEGRGFRGDGARGRLRIVGANAPDSSSPAAFQPLDSVPTPVAATSLSAIAGFAIARTSIACEGGSRCVPDAIDRMAFARWTTRPNQNAQSPFERSDGDCAVW